MIMHESKVGGADSFIHSYEFAIVISTDSDEYSK